MKKTGFQTPFDKPVKIVTGSAVLSTLNILLIMKCFAFGFQIIINNYCIVYNVVVPTVDKIKYKIITAVFLLFDRIRISIRPNTVLCRSQNKLPYLRSINNIKKKNLL